MTKIKKQPIHFHLKKSSIFFKNLKDHGRTQIGHYLYLLYEILNVLHALVILGGLGNYILPKNFGFWPWVENTIIPIKLISTIDKKKCVKLTLFMLP
jgi:hypothetical protein